MVIKQYFPRLQERTLNLIVGLIKPDLERFNCSIYHATDIVTIVGDLLDGDGKSLTDAAAPLAQLKSKYGNYFVTGAYTSVLP